MNESQTNLTSPSATELAIAKSVPSSIRNYYFGDHSSSPAEEDMTDEVLKFISDASSSGGIGRVLRGTVYRFASENEPLLSQEACDRMSAMELHLRVAYQAYHLRFPGNIWHCCSSCCFAMVAGGYGQASILAELLKIHEMAELIHSRIEKCQVILDERRKGVGGSSVVHAAPSRQERERLANWHSERQKAQMQLKVLAKEVLPFLYGQTPSPNGVGPIPRKLCTEVVVGLLGVSRNFIYARQLASKYDFLEGDDLSNIVDSAGVRMRQHRRVGNRIGFPDLRELPQFDCGCSEPCFYEVPYMRLYNEYREFIELSKKPKPRLLEHRYLLNRMFCPLSNTTVRICNKSLSALYTVSEGLVADARRILYQMCEDPSLSVDQAVAKCKKGYESNPRHPINRLDDAIREKVELHLDMLLRPDPGSSDGVNVCRVYSTELNTFEKLRKNIARYLEGDKKKDVYLSSSTLQRMIKSYLKTRNCRISFNQSDHNACPVCKSRQCTILNLSFEIKALKLKAEDFEHEPRPFTFAHYSVLSELETKEYQQKEAIDSMEVHNVRDANIRRMLKKLTDYFRGVDNDYREGRINGSFGWCERPFHAIITHQDDMTKVDLPCFIKTASCDITRWRFDVNAHVSAVTDESIVFSHEQGTGPKNSASILELIILDHVLRCRGEGIKVVVSDNASVGKNWLSVVAFPQYMVDQGLADIVLVVFLENNHGKWLADMLFGQLQIRRRSSTVLGIDGLLAEFESINRKKGSVRGYAVNPLSCVDFSLVLESLGYRTSPPKGFGFNKRNVHFSCACKEGAKSRLPLRLRGLIGECLPDERGMVRLCREPPSDSLQEDLPYLSRYFDVPAAAAAYSSSYNGWDYGDTCTRYREVADTPLVVTLNKEYAASGPGVVSHRNTLNVGFNGLKFRKLAACPELQVSNEPLVKEAWPTALIRFLDGNSSDEPVSCSETIKCAPENWVLREPVQRINQARHREQELVARYPPRNMLNARYEKGPRESEPWKPTATYYEPPVPIIQGTSAEAAMGDLGRQFTRLEQSVTVLDILRCIFVRMGNRGKCVDPWLQRNVTLPPLQSVEKYLQGVHVFQEREKGHPKAAKTVKHFFKSDADIDKEARELHRQKPHQTVSKLKDDLYAKAEKTPGALDTYISLEAKDIFRYAEEMKHFTEVRQRKFDEDNGLLPRNVTKESDTSKELETSGMSDD